MVPFNDLKPLHQRYHTESEAAIRRVLEAGWYLLGPELEAFEAELAAYHGNGHAVGVANGTDAIELALRAAGVGPGDEVITVAHTAVATVCAIERAGARPVLVDIDPRRLTLCPRAAQAAVTPRTRALVPVHLYGQPADMPALLSVARQHNLLVIEDCAQAHGALCAGRKVGTWGDLAAFSFYPTKNLGGMGDGGAVFTRDRQLANRLRRLRNYGQTDRYHHLERGINSRLDELQAAILRVRLKHLDENNTERRRIRGLYRTLLDEGQGFTLLPEAEEVEHVYHLLVGRHPCRDRLRQHLQAQGVGTLIHYPVPIHLQPAYQDLGYRQGELPVTERIAADILSLPLYVGMQDRQVEYVAKALLRCSREAA